MRCWLGHVWSKWAVVSQTTIEGRWTWQSTDQGWHDVGVIIRQERRCERCGLMQGQEERRSL